MPVLAVIFPREGSDPSKWRSYGTTQVTNLHLFDFVEFGTYIQFFLHHEAGSANFCLTIFESLSGKAMFCSERRVPFDGEY